MNWKTLLHDFRGQMSWGRFCSLVALTVSVVLQCLGKLEVSQLKVWLGVAVGSYGASKLTEAVVSRLGDKNESDDGVQKP